MKSAGVKIGRDKPNYGDPQTINFYGSEGGLCQSPLAGNRDTKPQCRRGKILQAAGLGRLLPLRKGELVHTLPGFATRSFKNAKGKKNAPGMYAREYTNARSCGKEEKTIFRLIRQNENLGGGTGAVVHGTVAPPPYGRKKESTKQSSTSRQTWEKKSTHPRNDDGKRNKIVLGDA